MTWDDISEPYANLGCMGEGGGARSAPRSGDPVIGESGDRKIEPEALKPTPIWDDLGWASASALDS